MNDVEFVECILKNHCFSLNLYVKNSKIDIYMLYCYVSPKDEPLQ